MGAEWGGGDRTIITNAPALSLGVLFVSSDTPYLLLGVWVGGHHHGHTVAGEQRLGGPPTRGRGAVRHPDRAAVPGLLRAEVPEEAEGLRDIDGPTATDVAHSGLPPNNPP